MRLILVDPEHHANFLGWNSIEVIKMNFDGEHSVMVLYDDERIDYLLISDFKEVISDDYYEIDKAWLRDRKLKSIGI